MQAQSEPDGVSSQKEARRLAFYLFWNVRGSYDRSAVPLNALPSSAKYAACNALPIQWSGRA